MVILHRHIIGVHLLSLFYFNAKSGLFSFLLNNATDEVIKKFNWTIFKNCYKLFIMITTRQI